MSTHSDAAASAAAAAAAARTFLFVLCFNMVRIPVGVRDFPLLQTFQTGSGAHRSSYSVGTGTFLRGRDVTLTTHLQLLPKLEMSGAKRLLPLYAFMETAAGTTLPLLQSL
jgi:hypothetical protein